jgi:uncharacterized protein YdeI (YjbR/CyaY-like superfamily)
MEPTFFATCFGWIDGVRRSLGPDSYSIRFTPRQARSTWSAVNVKRVGELIEEGAYRRAAIHWVTSAKRAETHARRLQALIEDSAAGRPVKPLTRPGG